MISGILIWFLIVAFGAYVTAGGKMKTMPYGMKVLVGGLCAIIVANIILSIAGFHDAAFILGTFGTIALMGGVMIWIVLVDSKKRWPSKSAFDRFSSVITFDPSRETPR